MKPFEKISLVLNAFFCLIFFAGCIDGERDLYDPTYQTENPLEISAPDGFDWKTTNSVKLNVEADDEYDGTYFYTIEVFDNNPIASNDSIASLAKGTATKGQPFVVSLLLSKQTASLYIQQTDPKGRSVVKSYDVQETMNCDFKTSVSSTVSAATRAAATRTTVAMPDYTTIPSGAIEVSSLSAWSALEGNKVYKMTGTYNRTINFWGNYNTITKLFVQGTWTIPSDFTFQNGIEVIVMNGGKIISTRDIAFVNSSYLTIMPGGSVSFRNLEFTNSGNELKNWGTVTTTQDLKISNGGLFYSKGTIVAEDASFNSSSLMQNEGTISLSGLFYMPYNASLMNTGEITAYYLQANGVSLTNNGKMIFNSIYELGNSTVTNNCFIESKLDVYIYNTSLNFNKGYLKGKDIVIKNCMVKLYNGSMIEATRTLDNESGSTYYDGGTGNRSLLKSPNMSGYGLYYYGNLTVEVNKHPLNILWFTAYYLQSPAQMARYGKSNVIIEVCTGTANEGDPGTDPENPTFPIESVNNTTYTYMFEDLWPLYGDYDMNDVVIRVKKTTLYLNSSNKVEKFKLEAELVAVGASKNIAAAVQFDNVPASSVSAVEYTTAKPTPLFIYNSIGLEEGQEKAVVPLFADAHKHMGGVDRAFVNTVKGSSSNKSNSPITISLLFSTPTLTAEDFGNDKLNFFIITDGLSSRRKEVHVVNYPPTDKASTAYFGNNNDDSSISAGRYYISKNNLAWATCVASNMFYPLEYANMKSVFPNFVGWLTSGGAAYSDWYTNYDSELIFQ